MKRKSKAQIVTSVYVNVILREYSIFSAQTLYSVTTQLIGAALVCCSTAVKNRWTRKAHKGLGFLQPDACCYY